MNSNPFVLCQHIECFWKQPKYKFTNVFYLVFFQSKYSFFSFSVNNLIAYNIKYTYLLALRTLVGMDFPRTPSVHCWTGGNGSSLNAPSVLQISVWQDKSLRLAK